MFFLNFSKVFSKKGAVMTVASICIAAAVLTLIGLFSALGINAAALTQRLGSNAEINIYIKSDLGDRDITDIETDLKHIDGVANVRFYSREDRMEKVSREVYGDDGYVFEQGENPLRDSYIIPSRIYQRYPRLSKRQRQRTVLTRLSPTPQQ